ncbi:MAG: endonuclease domain-containing protein [Acidimicrobiales bacterium]
MSEDPFRYEGYHVDARRGRVVCRYALGAQRFTEEVSFETADRVAEWDSAPTDAAARILFLLAGVSYYKTGAPHVIDLGTTETTPQERAFLRNFYVEGLGELAYRNGLDLSGLEIVGPELATRRPAQPVLDSGRPLVPFGAGIDSIVTVAHVARRIPGVSLFVVSRAGERFAAIEDAAAVTGLPVVRAERRIDPSVLRSAELGFLNGHVPVTAILSAIAIVAAVLGGHDAVVMSNERSSSVPTVRDGERAINHQWSKSAAFESSFRSLLGESLTSPPEYFSFLRSRSELWVASEFAALERYHRVFRSCNRAFAIDPARRLDHWCGTCDKCCFVDLVLAPFFPAAVLSAIFEGREPLGNVELEARFRALAGIGGDAKPFECVGDEEECRAAAVLAAERPDRTGTTWLHTLDAEIRAAAPIWGDPEARDAAVQRLLAAHGPELLPPAFAAQR